MIASLSGKVTHTTVNSVVIQTSGGVGYHVFPTLSLRGKAQEGSSIECFIMTIVREQEISLYGFTSWAERTLFEKCLSVSGIGPKVSLKILSLPVDMLCNAIESSDTAFITQVPGIGKKGAEKMILELRGKLGDIAFAPQSTSSQARHALGEALEALMGLGFNEKDVRQALQEADENLSAEELVAWFLSHGK